MFHHHPSLETGRVYFASFGSEDGVNSQFSAQVQIPLQISGVLL
jgi:hypothetical protein